MPNPIPANSSPLNQAALPFLKKKAGGADPLQPFVLQLARWGLANGAPLSSLARRNPETLEDSLDLLLLSSPEVVMWHFRDHDPADEADEQALLRREKSLAAELSEKESPEEAAALLLDRAMDSLALKNPALRP